MRYLILIGLLAAGIVGYTIFWFGLARETRSYVERMGELQAPVIEAFSHGPISITGFPFRAIVTLERPQLTLRLAAADIEWQGETITAYFQPWQPAHIILDFKGEQRLHFKGPGGLSGGQFYSMRGEKLSVSVNLGSSTPRISADFKNIAWQGAAQGTAAALLFHMRGVSEPPDFRGEADNNGLQQQAIADIALTLDEVHIPRPANYPLAETITQLHLQARIHGDATPGWYLQNLNQWRENGGTIDISQFELAWPPINISSYGTLALDAQGRPEGALTGTFSGYRNLIDALVFSQALTPINGQIAKVGLTALAMANGAGQPTDTIDLSVALQGGSVYLGPVRIAAFGPVWPLADSLAR